MPKGDLATGADIFLPVLERHRGMYRQDLDDEQLEKMCGRRFKIAPQDKAAPPREVIVVGYSHTTFSVGSESAEQWFVLTADGQQFGIVNGWEYTPLD